MIDLGRFKKPALQFSGGKDSLACLYLCRDQLDDILVYHLDTGDMCPETKAVVALMRPLIPNFIEIKSDARGWRALHGDPSDLVPASSHWLADAYGIGTKRLTSRFDCCFQNLMTPMHNRMVSDGVDAVIRGTKLCDTGTLPMEGFTGNYHLVLPLRDWSHEQVFAYLKSQGAPYNSIYKHAKSFSAPECLTCTAWWGDGRAAYLKAKHPKQHGEYTASLNQIRQALKSHLSELDAELRS